jgi:hypothetical protein
MLPVVENFVKKFELKEFVIVTGSGLISIENITDNTQSR